MKVPYSYYEDEVRDGFYINGLMKRAWAASIEVLEEIDRICKKYGITYFASSGTMLGAVRHHGFIPWDDDVDICLVREEYEKFLKAAAKELKDSKFFYLINIHTQTEYDQVFSRIVNGMSISYDQDFLDKFHGFPFVVGVDIFPLDYLAGNVDEEKLRCDIIKIIDGVIAEIDAINKAEVNNNDSEAMAQMIAIINDRLNAVEKLCKTRINRSGNIINQLFKLKERMMALYTKEDSDEVVLMATWVSKDKQTGGFKRQLYNYGTKITFEKSLIEVPVMYDTLLRMTYGNYMKCVHDGSCHDYPFYSDQMNFLESQTGIVYPKYKFNQKDLIKNRIYNDKMDYDRYLASQTKNTMGILKEAHNEICNYCGDINVVLDILAQCQEMSIALENSIEEIKGEEFEGIKFIEKYCEKIYFEYEKVNANCVEGKVNLELLNQALSEMQDNIMNFLDSKEEVVFVVSKADSWKYLEHFYEKENKRVNVNLNVVVVPYYYKNPDFSIREEIYEIDKFPSELNVIEYKDIDLEALQPDRIYIHNAYDEFNHTLTVATDYYASNLKKYTDELIYVMDFVVDAIEPGDDKGRISMDYFVTMPGVVQSDKVIVWSEAIKKNFVNKLMEFAGNDTRYIWEQKLSVNTRYLPVNEYVIPEEWREIIYNENGTKRKIVLFYTSASKIIEFGENYIEKIISVLEILNNNRDIVVIWKSEITESLQKIAPEVWQRYNSIVEKFIEQNMGIWHIEAGINDILSVCDAYYGDVSYVAQMCRNKKIPVMLQGGRM